MAHSIWPTIHAERRALADDLADLPPQQWTTPSLCGEWNVHQVLGHQLATAKMTPPKFARKLAAARFNFDRYVAKEVDVESAGGPPATLAAFRAAQGRQTAPPGPKDTWLGEVFVHGEDIRRPLGIKRDYPLPEVVRAIMLYARSNVVIPGKKRVTGLTLKATDIDFSIGSGPLIEGPATALLLAVSGRAVAFEELSGPGVATLRGRL